MVTFHAERAWLGRVENDVAIDVADDGLIAAVRIGAPRESGDHALPGLTIPGFVNAHSHAFHRALRGRTQNVQGDFWKWRDAMYVVAGQLDPDLYYSLARGTYAEMALAGITHVYEFHYVHHDRDGRRYADPNEMAQSLARAAVDAGVRLTLLDTCYLQGGLRNPEVDAYQWPFVDADVDEWADRVRSMDLGEHAETGVAIHSVRAVDRASMRAVAELADELQADLHVHVSEQRLENDECMAVHGMSPTELLAEAGALGPRTTGVHATHVSPMDVELLTRSRTTVCMCPTTERDLGDGVGPASWLLGEGVRITFGSDSHAVIDMFEEARCAELHERLVSNHRGLTPAYRLFEAAIGGRSIAKGTRADFIAVDTRSPRLAGGADHDLDARLVFCATSADVTNVVAGGRVIVADRAHVEIDVSRELDEAIGRFGW